MVLGIVPIAAFEMFVKFWKLGGFRLFHFCEELPDFSKPKYITHLQISQAALYNTYLLDAIKKGAFF
jgi:hypothetical protein